MSEIKSSYRGESDNNDYETDALRQKLDQEIYEKHMLLKELDTMKRNKESFTKTTQQQDTIPLMIEGLVGKIENMVMQNVQEVLETQDPRYIRDLKSVPDARWDLK